MALTASLSQKELERVALLCYSNRPVRVSLATDPTNLLTAESSVADWDAKKISGGGYSDYRGTLGTGSYDASDGRYELPYVDASFTADSTGFSYNYLYVVLGNYVSINIDTIAVTSNVATIVTEEPHGFIAGEYVVLQNTSAGAFDAGYTIISTPTPTSFTVAKVKADQPATADPGTANTVEEETYLHSLMVESPNKVLTAGQTQTYRILFATDN